MAYIKDYELRKIFLDKTNSTTSQMEVPGSNEKIYVTEKGIKEKKNTKPKSSDYKYNEVYDAIKDFIPSKSEK